MYEPIKVKFSAAPGAALNKIFGTRFPASVVRIIPLKDIIVFGKTSALATIPPTIEVKKLVVCEVVCAFGEECPDEIVV